MPHACNGLIESAPTRSLMEPYFKFFFSSYLKYAAVDPCFECLLICAAMTRDAARSKSPSRRRVNWHVSSKVKNSYKDLVNSAHNADVGSDEDQDEEDVWAPNATKNNVNKINEQSLRHDEEDSIEQVTCTFIFVLGSLDNLHLQSTRAILTKQCDRTKQLLSYLHCWVVLHWHYYLRLLTESSRCKPCK